MEVKIIEQLHKWKFVTSGILLSHLQYPTIGSKTRCASYNGESSLQDPELSESMMKCHFFTIEDFISNRRHDLWWPGPADETSGAEVPPADSPPAIMWPDSAQGTVGERDKGGETHARLREICDRGYSACVEYF